MFRAFFLSKHDGTPARHHPCTPSAGRNAQSSCRSLKLTATNQRTTLDTTPAHICVISVVFLCTSPPSRTTLTRISVIYGGNSCSRPLEHAVSARFPVTYDGSGVRDTPLPRRAPPTSAHHTRTAPQQRATSKRPRWSRCRPDHGDSRAGTTAQPSRTALPRRFLQADRARRRVRSGSNPRMIS